MYKNIIISVNLAKNKELKDKQQPLPDLIDIFGENLQPYYDGSGSNGKTKDFFFKEVPVYITKTLEKKAKPYAEAISVKLFD